MTSKAQREVLIGLQGSANTGVDVDTALRAVASMHPVVEKKVPDEDIGSYAPARHYIGAEHAEGSLEQSGLYQEGPYMASMAMGKVNPTGSGPWTWLFPLPDAAATGFALWSLEYTDGGTNIVRSVDTFATDLEISGEAGDAWELKASLVGGQLTLPDAVTASPTPSTVTLAIKMADTTLYVDSTYAGIGGTPISDALIGFSWKLEKLQHQKQFAGSIYPKGQGNDKWEVTLELTLEADNATTQAEIDKILLTTQSAIRVQSVSGTYYARIDGVFRMDDVKSLDDRDGNNIIKLTYKGEKDSSDNTGGVTFINYLSAL